MERELARAHVVARARGSAQRRAAARRADRRAPTSTRDARQAAVTEYMAFLKDRDILTIRDYMDPALRARVGRFTPAPREFFSEVDHHDPQVMRTHGYHWFDKAQMAQRAAPEPDPPRAAPLQHLHHAHRGARDRLGRDDAAGRHVRSRGRARAS